MNDAKCTEINEKSILRSLVFEIWSFFVLKIGKFDEFSTQKLLITLKI